MEHTRQRLSQRRKAATLTQVPLAGGLGAERSAGLQWEPGESLRSPGTTTTLAPEASLDQVAGLFTESKAGRTEAVSAGIARPAGSNSAGSQPDTPVPTTVRTGGFADSAILAPIRIGALNRPFPAAISSRLGWLKRFPAVGVLALVFAGGAITVPFATSRSEPVPPATAGIPASTTPVAAIPAPGPASSNDEGLRTADSTGAVHSKPAAVPNSPADGRTAPSDALPPVPHNTQNIDGTISEHKPPTATTSRPPQRPMTPAEAYDAWSRAAGFNAGDQPWTRLRSPHR